MVRDQIGYYVAILVAILGAIASVTQLLKARREKAAEARAELEKAFDQGRRSRDDEVALMKVQLDAAKQDRDDARQDRDEARRQLSYMQGGPAYGRPRPRG